jgi:hypothetical protein
MSECNVYNSLDSILKLNDGSQLRDISPNIVSITPHFGSQIHDATALGAVHERPYVGMDLTSLDLELVYNEDASVGTDTVLAALLEDETARAYEYYPRGTGAGKTKFYGTGFVENYQPLTRVGSLVRATATLRAITRTKGVGS